MPPIFRTASALQTGTPSQTSAEFRLCSCGRSYSWPPFYARPCFTLLGGTSAGRYAEDAHSG